MFETVSSPIFCIVYARSKNSASSGELRISSIEISLTPAGKHGGPISPIWGEADESRSDCGRCWIIMGFARRLLQIRFGEAASGDCNECRGFVCGLFWPWLSGEDKLPGDDCTASGMGCGIISDTDLTDAVAPMIVAVVAVVDA
ncbi:hypothetical protein BDD12DRAFT_805740 [Trichophaea hybrida]|nr:hypothetical protein BDD12DRAFT_805740 [Trichophaea hybrida]